MATQGTTEEAVIRRRIEDHALALREMDLEAVMSIYAPGVVSFDITPPLWYRGLEAKRKAWLEAFAAYRPPLGYEIREPTIVVGDDVAFSHSLNRVSATLKSGAHTDFWLRWTACFRKIDGNWLIVHEQVSVPVDLQQRSAVLDLEP